MRVQIIRRRLSVLKDECGVIVVFSGLNLSLADKISYLFSPFGIGVYIFASAVLLVLIVNFPKNAAALLSRTRRDLVFRPVVGTVSIARAKMASWAFFCLVMSRPLLDTILYQGCERMLPLRGNAG